LIKFNGGAYRRFQDIPVEYIRGMAGTRNYVSLERILDNGKEWVLESFKGLQPESLRVLGELGNDIFLGITLIKDLLHVDAPDMVSPFLFIETPGGVVKIEEGLTEDTFEEGSVFGGSILALPDEISRSWLWRTGGWKIPEEIPDNPLSSRRLVAHPQASWLPINMVIASYGCRNPDVLMADVVAQVPRAVETRRNKYDGVDYKWVSMRCFLDTRKDGVQGKVGDQLFVVDSARDHVIYHVNNGDVGNIGVLDNPGEAVDFYSAYVLSGGEGCFDFSPWRKSIE
jgi:hypothetical protein